MFFLCSPPLVTTLCRSFHLSLCWAGREVGLLASFLGCLSYRLPFSFLDHGSCGIPTLPGLGVQASWSDRSSSPTPSSPPLFRTQAFRCDRTPDRLSFPRAPPAGTDAPGGRRWGWVTKSSVARRGGSESDSLDPPDASCAGRALLVSKRPSFGPAVRRPVTSAPTWRPCGSCPDSWLATPGLRESPSVPCIESVGMRSRLGPRTDWVY